MLIYSAGQGLRRLDTHGRFHHFTREITSCLAILHIKTLLKRGLLQESEFFPFRVDPISEGGGK